MTKIKPPTPPIAQPKEQGKVLGGTLGVKEPQQDGGSKKPLPPKEPKQHYKDTVQGQAASLLDQFDSNGDGGIDVARESVKFVGSRTEHHTVSIERLARVADLGGNRNGSAESAELQAVMLQYDTGPSQGGIRGLLDQAEAGDGRLTGSERERFLEDFGPEVGPNVLFRPDVELPDRFPHARTR